MWPRMPQLNRAVTNDKGEYSLKAYEGSYTIKVAAKGFYNSEFSVDIKGDAEKTSSLSRMSVMKGKSPMITGRKKPRCHILKLKQQICR